MSEETISDDDSPMVCVRAVVMTRDDSSGGWVPLAGGGLSKVGVYKQRCPDDPAAAGTATATAAAAAAAATATATFRIHGERPRDNLVMLECLLDQDLVYNKVTPTFHHWRIHQKKFGLTFQSPADARAFDRGVRKALEDLTLGAPTPPGTVPSERDGSEDEGCNAADTSCSSQLSATEHREQMRRQASLAQEPVRGGHYHLPSHDPYPRHYPSDCLHQVAPPPRRFSRHVSFLDEAEAARVQPRREVWLKGYEDYRYALALRRQLEHHNDAAATSADSYVHFDDKAESGSKKHDYSYPYLEGGPYSAAKDGLSVVVTQPSPGSKKRGGGGVLKPAAEDVERQRCVYCREMFAARDNGRGRCPDAPDPMRGCIHRASCLWCAESVLYHCMSDPEGDYTDPCSCDPTDDSFCLRWLALSGLSLLAPCMCCYPPLMLCHRCGERCGCCGGKHKAIS